MEQNWWQQSRIDNFLSPMSRSPGSTGVQCASQKLSQRLSRWLHSTRHRISITRCRWIPSICNGRARRRRFCAWWMSFPATRWTARSRMRQQQWRLRSWSQPGWGTDFGYPIRGWEQMQVDRIKVRSLPIGQVGMECNWSWFLVELIIDLASWKGIMPFDGSSWRSCFPRSLMSLWRRLCRSLLIRGTVWVPSKEALLRLLLLAMSPVKVATLMTLVLKLLEMIARRPEPTNFEKLLLWLFTKPMQTWQSELESCTDPESRKMS